MTRGATTSDTDDAKCILHEIIPCNQLSAPDFRNWIFEIEDRMMCHEKSLDRHTEDSPIKLKHTFTPGLYTREIFMPAGALIISRIHLFEHPFVISKGKVSIYDGNEIVTVDGHFQGVTQEGTKRILYIHEDTTWTTFHITEKKTFEEIDINGVVTCDTFEEFERFTHKEITI